MKWLFSLMVLTLPACTTTAPPARLQPAAASESTQTSGTLSITGDELKQTGRTDLSDALRLSSPIFR
jgi:hypothetical protein